MTDKLVPVEPMVVRDLRDGMSLHDNPNVTRKDGEQIVEYIDTLKAMLSAQPSAADQTADTGTTQNGELVKRLLEPRVGIHEDGTEELKSWNDLYDQCVEAAAALERGVGGEAVAYARYVDNTGSLHMCAKTDKGAIALFTAPTGGSE